MSQLATTIPGLGPARGGRGLAGPPIPGLEKKKGIDKRRRPRIGIDELNRRGIEAVREAGVPFKPDDRRSAIEKPLDWIDVPRSAVAHVIARVAGMSAKDISKLQDEGTFGKQIWTSDILKHLGVKNKVARGILGFIGDMAIDPLAYIGAATTSAKRLVTGAPRLLRAGMRAWRGTQKAAVAGKAAGISDDVARAVGLPAQRIAEIGQRLLTRTGSSRKAVSRLNRALRARLASRVHGTRGLSAADDARGLFAKFGERGYPALRVPFTDPTLTIKAGQRARLFKEFTQPLSKGAPNSLGKLIALKETLKAANKAGKAATKVAEEIKGIRFSPEAAESIKAVTRAKFGRFRAVEGADDFVSRFRRIAERTKTRLFGPGFSEAQTRAAATAQQLSAGAKAKGAFAFREFSKRIDPEVARLAASTGLDQADVHARLWDFIDTAGLPLWGDDVVQARMAETAQVLNLTGDENRKLLVELRKFGETNRDLLDLMKEKGVAPDELFGSARRVPTKEFQAAEALRQRTLPELSYNTSRVKEVRWTKPATLFSPEKVVIGYTSQTKKARRRLASMRAMAEELGGKIEERHISGYRFNTDKTLAASLVPDDFKGKFNVFETSIPGSAAAEAEQATKRLALADFRDIAAETGIRADTLAKHRNAFPGYTQIDWGQFRNTPAYKTVLKSLEGMAFPQQVSDSLSQLMTISAQPTEINRLLRWSDNIFGVWKGVTLLHPAYTLRNIAQNVIGMSMAGLKVRSAVRQSLPGSDVARVVRQMLNGKPVTGYVSIAGKTVDAAAFAKLLVQHNIVGSGVISQIPNIANNTRGFFANIASEPLRWWFVKNNQIESTMKAAALWSALDQGDDIGQALLRVSRAMPDLTDLTLFERNVAKRVFPWASWIRKNGALQLFHYLPRRPEFIAGPAKLQEAWEEAFSGDSVVPDELRPQWMREQQAVQVAGDKVRGTVFLAASWLPFQELVKLGAGLTDLGEGGRAVLESTRPGIRVVSELATSRDIFRRQESEPLGPGEIPGKLPSAILGQSGTPLDTLLAVRPLREAFGRVPSVAEEQGVGAAIARGVLGGAFQPVSAERGLQDFDLRSTKMMATLRSKMNTANSKGDMATLRTLLLRFVKLMRERQRLGLPITKASARALGEAGMTPQRAYPELQRTR